MNAQSFLKVNNDFKASTISYGIMFDDAITGEHASVLPL
jgi:hypothetical protein